MDLQQGFDFWQLTPSLAGAVVAATVFYGQRRQTQWKTTLDVIREFDSEKMLVTRREAYAVVRKHSVVDIIVWRSSDDAPISGEDADKIWSIIVFYERLWLLIKNNQIAKKSVLDAFGDNFYWWWEVCFVHIPYTEDEATMVHLHYFRGWIDRRVNAEFRNNERHAWILAGKLNRKAIETKFEG